MSPPIHVALDARYLARRQSGVGFYTERLVYGLTAIDRVNRYTFVVARDGPPLPAGRPNAAAWPTRISYENHLLGDLWLLGYLPARLRRLGVDVYHGPAVFLPLVKLGYRTVVTVHDLVSFLFRSTVPRKYSLYMRLMTRLAVRSADRVIAVSAATKNDLTRVLRVPDEKVVVIHEAIGPEFEGPADSDAVARVRRRYGIRLAYCLFVGNLEPRKNLRGLIEAFALLRARAPAARLSHQLVIAGTPARRSGGIYRAVEKHGLASDVVFTGYVPAAELPLLYAGASCFVFPSLYEGFGLPVLEAMATGIPVVASRAGAIPEVAGDAALLVDPGRPGEMADAVEALLTDDALRTQCVHRGRARARQFSWERVVRATLAVYEAVHFGRPTAPTAVPPEHAVRGQSPR